MRRVPLVRIASRLLVALGPLLAPAGALANNVATVESSQFLLIGNTINDSVIVSNFEIGADTDPNTPMAGLTLTRPIPANTIPIAKGISGDGNVAVTDPNGQFNFSDLDIWADPGIGVQCAGSPDIASNGGCNNGDSNTSFNGSPFGIGNGLTGNVDFTNLLLELGAAQTDINALAQTGTLDVSSGIGTGGQGVIANTDLTITLNSGFNVIDVLTGGGVDLLLQNSNLVIDGPSDAVAIFRLPDDANFKISQSAILLGDGGIELGSVLFFTDKDDNDTHYDFSSLLVNGVAFWDLSMFLDPSAINLNNVEGCTQFVGNKVNTGQNVRLTRCAFNGGVPEPHPAGLLGVALLVVALGAMSARGRSPS